MKSAQPVKLTIRSCNRAEYNGNFVSGVIKYHIYQHIKDSAVRLTQARLIEINALRFGLTRIKSPIVDGIGTLNRTSSESIQGKGSA